MRNKFLIIRSILIFILSTTSIIFPQQQPEQTPPDTIPQEPVIYKVSEIPQKFIEASSYLTELSNNLSELQEKEKSDSELVKIQNKYLLFKKQTDSLNLETELTTILKEFRQKWNIQKKKVSDKLDLITGTTKDLETQKDSLLKNKEIWVRMWMIFL